MSHARRVLLRLSVLLLFVGAAGGQADDSPASRAAFLEWVGETAIPMESLDWCEVDPEHFAPLDAALEGKRIVYLGESDHYLREKYEFRLILIRYLASRGFRVLGMEMGDADARWVDRYLETGDASHLRGNRIFLPDDENRFRQTIRGAALWENREALTRLRETEERFLGELRAMNEAFAPGEERLRWFGFDVGTRTPDGGYDHAAELLEAGGAGRESEGVVREIATRLERVEGEPVSAEIERLEGLLSLLERDRADVVAALGPEDAKDLGVIVRFLVDSLRFYELLPYGLKSPRWVEALVMREAAMMRRMDEVLAELGPDEKLVLMGHALHLSKKSESILTGPPPGHPVWRSIGTHLAEKLPGEVYGIWILYDHGEHLVLTSPRTDLRVASNRHRIESLLAKAGPAFLLPLGSDDPRSAYLDEMRGFVQNGKVGRARLRDQLDAIFFVEEVHVPWEE